MLPFPSFIVPLLLLASVSVLAIWDQAGDVTIASFTDGKYLSNVYFEIPAGAAGYGETQWDGSGKELQYRAAGGDGKLWQKFRPMKGLPPSDPESIDRSGIYKKSQTSRMHPQSALETLTREAKFEVKFDKPVEDFGNPSRATEDIGRNNVFMVKAAPSYLYPCHFETRSRNTPSGWSVRGTKSGRRVSHGTRRK
ncbi:uncharacterized protein MKK02DRAFT_28002 [Dioszegia hungarica]|uniref:Secreted protein n=1 Tax=Dioszegia hungarica TaxID=4972 RepID=A0AA38LRU7_9TREE|nr:uncharacterized protein MKK02DRAFT_28002 [Dioszegia hungarica]KAI9634872.1 hypothetical protein MKK02DRAFT_28002 [Dioszegia hungarica]